MCGINVIINPLTDGLTSIEQMMLATKHRGPDQSGFTKIDQHIFFAGNRLKILDLSDFSNQPLWTKEKDAVLVWNGALYNYQDLRNELMDLGCEFESSSDSEVLLQWLKNYGTEKLMALKGMFALAFADLSKKQVIIARDLSGEKPLYFFNEKKTWLFSSEAKGILAALPSFPEIDSSQFIPYFYYRNSFPDRSFFQNIHQILPGEVVVLDFEGNVCDRNKLKLPKHNFPKPDHTLFEEKLKDAVLKNFHAERPVGMFLSGGADSSLVYAMWYEETGQALPTFTVALDKQFQKKYSDPSHVDVFRKKYPGYHSKIEVNLKSVMENWSEYIRSLDQPIGDSAGLLTWLVAKQAHNTVKVLVSGAGADELFAGYNRHLAFRHYLKYPQLYKYLLPIGKKLPIPHPFKKIIQSIRESPDLTFIQMAALQPIPEQLLHLFKQWYPKSDQPFSNALEWDRTFYLVNDILKIHDNSCMAFGIEGRSPYLDQPLLDMANGFSENQALGMAGKQFIKASLIKRGLGHIAERKKLGFGLPLQEWMKQKDFRDWIFTPIMEMEKNKGESFPNEMRKLASNPEKAGKQQFLQLWNLFVLSSWLEKNEK